MKIRNERFDLVVLDFRLHEGDFSELQVDEITGLILLRMVKELNPGIQVIVLSATNKAWSLQAMLDAGADGFVVKDRPENSMDPHFTIESILAFKSLVQQAFERSFLIKIFEKLYSIQENILKAESIEGTDFELFTIELLSGINMIRQSAKNVKSVPSVSLDSVFMNCYSFLESFKDYLKEEDHTFVVGLEEKPISRYRFQNNTLSAEGQFIRRDTNDKPSFFQVIVGLLIDYFKVVDQEDSIVGDLWRVKNLRNNYVHGDLSSFSVNDLFLIINVCEVITKEVKE